MTYEMEIVKCKSMAIVDKDATGGSLRRIHRTLDNMLSFCYCLSQSGLNLYDKADGGEPMGLRGSSPGPEMVTLKIALGGKFRGVPLSAESYTTFPTTSAEA